MNIDRQNASIELTNAEGKVLLGQLNATPGMLADRNHPSGAYRTFKDKVEHRASELAYETGRTVEVFMDGRDERIAVCKEDELVVEA